MEYAVTRAADTAPYFHHKILTGIRIGKGFITARLYDKPLEIQQQSRKEWMYDIWGIKEIPEGKKIIRIEFQLRRKILKECGLGTAKDLFQRVAGAWAYCTKEWLKFQDRPGLHHTQRKTLKWYEEIQDGFNGVQGAEPLVREKAVSMDKKRLMQQANGLITALHAIDQEEKKTPINEPVKIEDLLDSYNAELKKHRPNPLDIQEKVTRKRSKYHREEPPTGEGQTIYRIRRH
jgi:hypothetical protein